MRFGRKSVSAQSPALPLQPQEKARTEAAQAPVASSALAHSPAQAARSKSQVSASGHWRLASPGAPPAAGAAQKHAAAARERQAAPASGERLIRYAS